MRKYLMTSAAIAALTFGLNQAMAQSSMGASEKSPAATSQGSAPTGKMDKGNLGGSKTDQSKTIGQSKPEQPKTMGQSKTDQPKTVGQSKTDQSKTVGQSKSTNETITGLAHGPAAQYQ